MDAKKLYKKHLKIHLEGWKGIPPCDKQLERLKYDASLDAINEVINLKQKT